MSTRPTLTTTAATSSPSSSMQDAYKAAVQIVGGEQYILSAVMHADEINRAMTEALGREVYHYHLHVVYVPVVEKQILWSKRCKDKALVGTVKETVMQVSRSKKWASKPLLDDAGKPILQKNGKPVLKKSYSVLQDDFFNYMRNCRVHGCRARRAWQHRRTPDRHPVQSPAGAGTAGQPDRPD